jgi:hypothetical protein
MKRVTGIGAFFFEQTIQISCAIGTAFIFASNLKGRWRNIQMAESGRYCRFHRLSERDSARAILVTAA